MAPATVWSAITILILVCMLTPLPVELFLLGCISVWQKWGWTNCQTHTPHDEPLNICNILLQLYAGVSLSGGGLAIQSPLLMPSCQYCVRPCKKKILVYHPHLLQLLCSDSLFYIFDTVINIATLQYSYAVCGGSNCKMVFVIFQTWCGPKVLKSWYGCVVNDCSTLSILYV